MFYYLHGGHVGLINTISVRVYMDGFMRKWANPHLKKFEIWGVLESPHHKLYLTKVLRPITFLVQAKVCLRMLLFDDFQRAQDCLTLTSDQVKKSEMDVSNNLNRKKPVHC